MPRTKTFFVRLTWLVFSGWCGVLAVPAAVAHAGIETSHAPDVLAVLTTLRLIVLAVGGGVVGGLVMQSQPWYRSLYLMLPTILWLSLPTVR